MPQRNELVTAVILCGNEEPNIRFCLESVAGWCRVQVVDSGSTDGTVAICREYTDRIAVHPYSTHAEQWQWTLANLAIETPWVLALDADFVVTEELKLEIDRRLPGVSPQVGGIYVRHRYVFGGGPIRFGGTKSSWLRLVRRGRVQPDLSDLVDFRFVVDGATEAFRGAVVEENRHDEDISVWTRKQDKFALRLALEEELRRARLLRWDGNPSLFGSPDERYMRLRDIWLRMPLFVRPVFYFLYRYGLCGGFLDGRAGFLYAALQGFWLRAIVDWKTLEIRGAGLADAELVAAAKLAMTTKDGSVVALLARLREAASGVSALS